MWKPIEMTSEDGKTILREIENGKYHIVDVDVTYIGLGLRALETYESNENCSRYRLTRYLYPHRNYVGFLEIYVSQNKE